MLHFSSLPNISLLYFIKRSLSFTSSVSTQIRLSYTSKMIVLNDLHLFASVVANIAVALYVYAVYVGVFVVTLF